MKLFKRLFCCHFWIIPFFQKDRGNGLFGFIRQYEWKCRKCGKIKWSDYKDIPPQPSYIDNVLESKYIYESAQEYIDNQK